MYKTQRFQSLTLFFFLNLPSVYGLEWPDINGPVPVSGDHGPFPGSRTRHDVIHASDDGDFGKTHDGLLKVLRFLQRLHRLHPELKVTFPNPGPLMLCCDILTSLTSQLTGDLRSRRADTAFFHQFHQCSLPDDQRQTDEP